MTLTKADLINQIYKTSGSLTKAQAKEVVEIVLDTIKDRLASGEDVLVSGFGKFSVKEKSERRGRNPQTGETLTIDPRRVVTFKPSGKLREKMNNAK